MRIKIARMNPNSWMKSALAGALVSLFPATPLRAASPVGASYLTINPFARVASMGGAGVALASDASSIFVNPAGLGLARTQEIAASHTQLFQDSSFDSLNYVHPINRNDAGTDAPGAFGVGAFYLTEGSIDGRSADRSSTGQFTASDMSGTFSYGQMLAPSIAAGASFKILQQRIAGDSATGVAIDAGARLATPVRGLDLGVALTNFGPAMKFVSENFSLPAAAQIGVGYQRSSVNLAADADFPVHGGESKFGLGAEYMPVSVIVLRMGYLFSFGAADRDLSSPTGQFSQFAGFAAGIGLRLGNYQVDYALVPHEQLGETQQLSFSVKFR